MHTNYSRMFGSTTAVLNAAAMQNDGKDVHSFINDSANGFCHYDTVFQKIYISLNETKASSRTNDWIKEFGEYFIYEESKKGIEDFHRIKFDPILKQVYAEILININDSLKSTISFGNLKALDKELFVKTDYNYFVKFSWNNGIIGANKVDDYTDNCYSYALFKSLSDKYELEDSANFYFFEYNDNGKKSIAFILEYESKNYEFYDFSNRPPKGGGGPFSNFLNTFFLNLLDISNKK